MEAAEDEAMLELCLAMDTMFPVDDEGFASDNAAAAAESSQRSHSSYSAASLPLVPE